MLIFELSTNFHFLGNIWSLYPQLFKLNHLRNCKQLKCKSGNYNQLKHAFIVDQVPQHCTQVIYFHCFYRCSASIQHSSALNKPDLSLKRSELFDPSVHGDITSVSPDKKTNHHSARRRWSNDIYSSYFGKGLSEPSISSSGQIVAFATSSHPLRFTLTTAFDLPSE